MDFPWNKPSIIMGIPQWPMETQGEERPRCRLRCRWINGWLQSQLFPAKKMGNRWISTSSDWLFPINIMGMDGFSNWLFMNLMFCDVFWKVLVVSRAGSIISDIHVTYSPSDPPRRGRPVSSWYCGAPATKCVSAFLLNSGRQEVRRT